MILKTLLGKISAAIDLIGIPVLLIGCPAMARSLFHFYFILRGRKEGKKEAKREKTNRKTNPSNAIYL